MATLGLLIVLTIVGAGLLVSELVPKSAGTPTSEASGVEMVVFVPSESRSTNRRKAPAAAVTDQAETLAQVSPGAVMTSPRPKPRPDVPSRNLDPRAKPEDFAEHGQDSALAVATAQKCSDPDGSEIPARRAGASSGSEFMAALSGLGGTKRDRRITAEVLAGNIPDFMRNLTPVTLKSADTTVTICVTPDYVAIGNDTDHVRVPMGLPAAAQIADGLGFMLPTTRMVDAIYADAGVQLTPQPMTPNSQMTSNNYIRRHNATIERQLVAADAVTGTLTAGHRKDLVLSNRLRTKPGRVAIYGWHRINGRPIQPLSTVHGQYYADYSHGVRLVSRTAYVNGRSVELSDLLSDARYAALISDEGPIRFPVRLIASLSN